MIEIIRNGEVSFFNGKNKFLSLINPEN